MNSIKALVVLAGFLVAALCYAGDQRTPAEKQLDQERNAANGIWVGQPKVYDDSILQQMLSAAEARLATLQVLDQTQISNRLGSVTGAAQTVNSLGISVQGPPTPQVVTTANGATNQKITTNQTSSTQSATPSTTTQNTTQNTTAAPVTNVVTTTPQIAPPTVTAPAPSTSLPTSFNVSASDILNEQMQLTYEIANLRLLLEGSLNDRLIYDPAHGLDMVKPRVTLGFPITLTPDARHKNAIAVVEIEIEKVQCGQPTPQPGSDPVAQPPQNQPAQNPAHAKPAEASQGQPQTESTQADNNPAANQGGAGCDDLEPNDPPAIVALLPREKTYNVASITESNVSIGAGVVTQVVGISGSFLHSRKTYYLVQDQDTVALTFQPKDPRRVGFLWEFRPVLGAKMVQEGLKQTFVQLSFPSDWSAPSFGTVHVRTYWRDYNAGKNVVKDIRAKSLSPEHTYPITNFPLDQTPKVFDASSLEDLGNGQMLVNLFGRFLGGTYVRVGSTILGDGTAGFSSEYTRIRFVAPITAIASEKSVLVSRDGSTWPIQLNDAVFKNCELVITGYDLQTVDDSNTRISVAVGVKPTGGKQTGVNPPVVCQQIPEIHKRLPLILLIGGKVFGYSDAPIVQNDNTLTAVVPTSLLAANPMVSVRSLFAPDQYWRNANISVTQFAGGGASPKIAVLETGTNSARYLLYGTSFGDSPAVLSPQGATLEAFGSPATPDMRSITLTKDQVNSEKQIIIERKDGFIFEVALPSVSLPDATKSTIKSLQPVTVGSDEAAFQGADFSTLQKVMFGAAELKLRTQTDGKVAWLSGLKAAGVTAAVKKQTVDFYFKSGKQSVSVDVVAAP